MYKDVYVLLFINNREVLEVVEFCRYERMIKYIMVYQFIGICVVIEKDKYGSFEGCRRYLLGYIERKKGEIFGF